MDITDPFAGMLVCSDESDLSKRMLQQYPQQLGSSVARTAKNCNPDLVHRQWPNLSLAANSCETASLKRPSELARPKQFEEETVPMRFAYAPFIVLGVTFIALGSSSSSRIYLPIGIVFLIIGFAVLFKRRRT